MAIPIPDDVKRFLAEHIDSAEQLDALVLLHTQPERAWTAEAVSQAIYSVPQAVARTLASLEARGFAVSNGAADPAYRYAPGNAENDARVRAVAETYRAQRVDVVKHLYAARAEPDPVRSFANAFRLRKDG